MWPMTSIKTCTPRKSKKKKTEIERKSKNKHTQRTEQIKRKRKIATKQHNTTRNNDGKTKAIVAYQHVNCWSSRYLKCVLYFRYRFSFACVFYFIFIFFKKNSQLKHNLPNDQRLFFSVSPYYFFFDFDSIQLVNNRMQLPVQLHFHICFLFVSFSI